MGFKNILIMVLTISLFSSFVAASTCQGAWGDDSSTYPVPTSFSQFSDSDTVGLNCHLSGSQCPVPQIEGTCDAANQGFMRCNIEVRDSSGTWTSIAQSTTGEHCDFNDDTGSNFATVSNFMINHDDVTDIRCKAYALSYDSTFEVCQVTTKGHDKRDDWWYNENTPTANSVVINPNNPTTLDDLNCTYNFTDADNDTENTSAAQYKWFVNDVDIGINNQFLSNNSTDVSDIVVCSVKVFDDVFVTGNEAFVNSSPVNITDTTQPPGTLPQRREMGLEFEDKVETSYVMNGEDRIVEISNDDKIYLHNDNVGSSSLKTDDSGEINSEIINMPFGSTKTDTGDGTSKSFYTGKETDNTGLQYFGQRYYDPISGRFTQIDPIQRSSISNYHYANNNPNKYVDPDGRSPRKRAVTSQPAYREFILHFGNDLESRIFTSEVSDDFKSALANSLPFQKEIEKIRGVRRDLFISFSGDPINIELDYLKDFHAIDYADHKYMGYEHRIRINNPRLLAHELSHAANEIGDDFLSEFVASRDSFDVHFRLSRSLRSDEIAASYGESAFRRYFWFSSSWPAEYELSVPKKVIALTVGGAVLDAAGIGFGLFSAYNNFKEGNIGTGLLDLASEYPPIGLANTFLQSSLSTPGMIKDTMENNGGHYKTPPPN